MKYLLRGLIKGISAIIVSLLLIGLAGLWRLATHPLHITHSTFIVKYLPSEFGFQDIYLSAHAYYTIPEIEVRQATYTSPGFALRAPTLYASWNIFSLLRGNFNVSVVTLDQPEITIRSTDTTEKPFLDVVNEALSQIPLKYLAIENGTLTIIDAQQKEWRLERTSLYMLRLLRQTNVSGSSHILGFARPLDMAFRGKLLPTREYEGTIKVSHLLLDTLPIDDAAVQSIFKHYASPISGEFYVHADPRKTATTAPGVEWSGSLRFDNDPPAQLPLKFSGSWVDQGLLRLRFQKERLALSELKTLWPPIAPTVKEWLLQHIPSADVKDADLTLEWMTKPSGLLFSQIKGSAGFTHGTARPISTLPPVKHLSGSFDFDTHNAHIVIDKGSLDTIHLNNSTLDLKGYNAETPTHLRMTLNASGPLTGLNALLQKPSVREKIPHTLHMQKGTFTVQGPIAFPLEHLTERTVSYALKGKITNGQWKLIMPSKQKYQFDDVRLTYAVTPTQRVIEGQSTLNGLALQFQHQENLTDVQHPIKSTHAKGSGSIQGLLALTPSSVASQVVSPKGGTVQFDGTYQEKNNRTEIKSHVDFGAATLAIPFLQWSKTKGQPGALNIDLRLHKGALESLKQLDIKTKGLVLQGKAQFDPTTNRLYKVILDPFQINGASAKGIAEFKNNIWDIAVKAPYIRPEPLLKIGQGSQNLQDKPAPGVPSSPRLTGYDIRIDIPNVLLDKGFRLQNLKSFMKIRDNRFHALTLEAHDEGKPLTVFYRPVGSEMVLDLHLPRIENFLQGLNITDRVGAEGITIHATKPLKHMDTSIKGKLFIDKVSIQKAPAFAKLLSLVSISGLINALQDKGLVFTDNYAKFEYLDQKIALRRSRVMNGSIGITAVGIVDLKQKTLNIQGVLVPANFFSQLIGKVPILGQLLTGGKDKGLFSVSYGASGSFSDPKITSNPLGILAPNILKNLFEGITKGKSEKPTFRTDDIEPPKKKRHSG